jgi:hypothetical protein
MNSIVALFAAMEAKSGPCGELICPKCGSNNTHQSTVTVYNRGEDAAVTTVTSIGREVITGQQASSACRNPSGRRHGIRIEMDCEQCPECPALVIYQHKGCTIVEWDTDQGG